MAMATATTALVSGVQASMAAGEQGVSTATRVLTAGMEVARLRAPLVVASLAPTSFVGNDFGRASGSFTCASRCAASRAARWAADRASSLSRSCSWAVDSKADWA